MNKCNINSVTVGYSFPSYRSLVSSIAIAGGRSSSMCYLAAVGLNANWR